MKPLTDVTPKPLLKLRGMSLIERHLRNLATAGVRDFVINCGWLGEQIPPALGNGSRFSGSRIHYSMEGWPALETGGGIHNVLSHLGDDPFLVVNGDVYAECDWRSLSRRGLQRGDLAHLLLVPNPPHHPKGDFGLVASRIGEDGMQYTFSGISILHPDLFADCQPGRFQLAPLLRKAADHGRVTGELFQGRWVDIGTPERLARLEKELS